MCPLQRHQHTTYQPCYQLFEQFISPGISMNALGNTLTARTAVCFDCGKNCLAKLNFQLLLTALRKNAIERTMPEIQPMPV
jgi:hypothetical protein